MSTTGTALTTWEEFVQIPDEEEGMHYELHDGEVVVVPPPKPFHTYLQSFLTDWFNRAARGRGLAMSELPYRPAANLQYWYADVGYMSHELWKAMRSDEYLVFTPELIVEVLSPSNRPAKTERQRLVAFSAGTREFWVIDPARRTIEVSLPGKPSRIYTIEETIPVAVLPGAKFPVRILFE
jgi:Uma2 family endonuclease